MLLLLCDLFGDLNDLQIGCLLDLLARQQECLDQLLENLCFHKLLKLHSTERV